MSDLIMRSPKVQATPMHRYRGTYRKITSLLYIDLLLHCPTL
ncbi:MAG TPA: hypothetical protein V6D15_22130 [Oculatellaceae cyanobacterium]